jgi:hypothetical protein
MPTDVAASKYAHEGDFNVKTTSEWSLSFCGRVWLRSSTYCSRVAWGGLHAGNRRPPACGIENEIVSRHLAAHVLSFELDRFLRASVLLGKTLM